MATVAHTNHAGPKKAKFLQWSLWTVQALLALAFVMAGSMKATTPYAELATKMAWVGAVPEGLVRFIGIAELLGGIGLVVPAVTRIRPSLTALAGAGLALVMLLASFFHLSRGEAGAVPVNLVLGGLAAFVAWGRWKKAPIVARRDEATGGTFTL
jgi:putative oxidoreductase